MILTPQSILFWTDKGSSSNCWGWPCLLIQPTRLLGRVQLRQTLVVSRAHHIKPGTSDLKIEFYLPVNWILEINLCTFFTVIVDITAKVVSQHQRCFISGRHISECILSASEEINLLNNDDNMALKFDIQKAFRNLD